jgi:hypothetical protein
VNDGDDDRDASTAHRLQRALVVVSAALWYTTLLVLFVARLEVSHTYFHTIRSAPIALPALTRSVALPILGGAAAQGEGVVLFALVWGALFGLPAIGLWWSLSAKRAEPLDRWAVAMSLYLPLVALVVALVAFGLWLPQARLMGRM